MAKRISKERWEDYRKTLPDRTSAGMYRYFEIVQKNYDIYKKYNSELDAIINGSDSIISAIDFIEYEYSKIKVIIFSALFLEAIINDYGATNLSDRYMKNYLDKLDVKSKWAIIPKLVTGEEFPKDSQAFELLGKLKRLRNKLVHYKTRKIPKNYDEYEKFIQNEKLGLIDVDDAHKCIAECLLELSKIDNTKWNLFTSDTFSKIISGEVIW